MNSKELLKKIELARIGNGTQSINDVCLILNKEETLEHLKYVEQLEKELKRCQDTIKKWMGDHKKLIIDNGKMKKALEKACERLEYICPVEVELIEDLDCENCEDNYKECWKKFFLKEGNRR